MIGGFRSRGIFQAAQVAVIVLVACVGRASDYPQDFLKSLTYDERAWLDSRQELVVGVLSDSPPLAFNHPREGSQGIMPDYLDLIAGRTGMKLVVSHLPWPQILARARNNGFDFFPAIDSGERRKDFHFSREYFAIPGVIYAKTSVPYISGPAWLADKRVAVIADANYHNYMANHFPGAVLVPCRTADECLELVNEGKVDAFVGDRFTGSHIISQNYPDELKIAGSSGGPDELLRFAVPKDRPELVSILNKAITTISRKEHDEILHRWTTVRYEHQFDYIYLWWITGGVLLVFAGLFLWNWQLSRAVAAQTRKLEESNQWLRESETKFRTLVEKTNDIFHSVSMDGTLTYLSPQAVRYGIDPEKVVSGNFFDLILPEDREKVAADLERAIVTGEEFPTEFRIIDGEGRLRWFEERGSVLLDASGKAIGTSGVLRDVTNRKREERLWSANLRLIEQAESGSLRQFLNLVVMELKLITDSEKGFFKVRKSHVENTSFQAISINAEFGICRQSVLSDPSASDSPDILQRCFDAKKPIVCNDCQSLPSDGGNGAEPSAILRALVVPLVRKDEVVAVMGVGNKKNPYDDNDLDQVKRLGNLAWEIFERKQAFNALKENERELRQAQSIARVGSYTWNRTGGTSSWSKQTANILGIGDLEPSHELLVSLIHPDDLQAVTDGWHRAMGQNRQFNLEYRIVRPEGTVRWVHDITTASSPDIDGLPGPVFGTLQDITERKEAEIKLQQTLAELKRWHNLTIGREERIQFLKDEVNELLERLGEQARYRGNFSP